MKKLFCIFFILSINLFSQYHYSPTPRVGNVKPLIPNQRIPLYQPRYDLYNQRYKNYGYTKTYYRNGRFYKFGNGNMTYQEREKLKAIDGRYSPRIRMLEDKMRVNNSKILSEIYQKSPNNNAVNSAVNDNFRIQMQIQMMETLRNLEIDRNFK